MKTALLAFSVAILFAAVLLSMRYARFNDGLVLDRLTGRVFVPALTK